ncbi:MAG TPA: hypothetical protein H9744_07940 [Candidatus Eisenbergiella stercoravium]|nr:hypothetical protein [Candidatus Eisenbergiella stercoravium]
MEIIMECISISFRSAPEETRKRFAFPAGETGIKEREAFLERVGEAVLLSTCNRTEVYAAGEGSFGRLEALLSEKSGMAVTEVKRIARRFAREKACAHLYRVACGMDSMVVGEDEILGQVRTAYLFSAERGLCGYELNAVFQGALACAKKIKTETLLSKTSVSVATLACAEIFRFAKLRGKASALSDGSGAAETDGEAEASERKRTGESADKRELQVLLIGGSGKMGGSVLKNLLGREGIHVYATRRSHGLGERENSRLSIVDYGDRCRFLEQADVIVSATESPHYTLTAGETEKYLKRSGAEKPRLFIDMAVPADIDRQIASLPGCRVVGMDDFERLAEENNRKKQQAVLDAGALLEEELEELYKALLFHETAGQLDRIRERFDGYSVERFLFYLKDRLDAASLKAVLQALKE